MFSLSVSCWDFGPETAGRTESSWSPSHFYETEEFRSFSRLFRENYNEAFLRVLCCVFYAVSSMMLVVVTEYNNNNLFKKSFVVVLGFSNTFKQQSTFISGMKELSAHFFCQDVQAPGNCTH